MVKPGLTVLQVIPELDAGGAERTTLEIVEAVTTANGRALVASQGGRLESELEKLGGELFRLPVKSKSPFTLWKNRSRLIDIIRSEQVDLIHARSRAPAWSALWAARATNTPFVTTYHGSYGGKSAPKKLYNSVMARGDLVIANSEFIAAHIRETYPLPEERLVTIPRGVDTRQFDPSQLDPSRTQDLRKSLQSAGRYLLTLPARLTEWKGQRLLLEALAQLSSDEQTLLSVALIGDAQGRTGYLDALESDIKRLHLDELVKISGHYSDMPHLYAASDLVLAPSVRPEAFGRVAVEAQVMGKPVIASNHGGQRETVRHGETGWLVEPGNAHALADAIRSFLHQPDTQRLHMAETARANVLEHFTTAALQEKTLDVYDRAISLKARASD
ncbi:MAG: glycosyl transferase [Ponticaulis sp.]|nr:glycosyl transferase [Ponticaulis sp.]